MAVLEKIRVRMGVFISVVIGLALLSFIIDPSTLQSAMSMFSSKYDVGKMNRKSITYQDFTQKVDYYTNIQQLVSGSSSLDERGTEMVHQRVWQDYMDEFVLFPAINMAGVTIGDEELFDLTQGKEISPALQQEQIFLDQNGAFSRTQLLQFVQTMGNDGSGAAAQYWRYLESNILQAQMYIKYFCLLEKSTILNTIELRRSMEENNITSDVRFVMLPVTFSTDTTLNVTTQDIKAYYDKNKAQYEQLAGRDIDYVQFTVVPSLADFDKTEADFLKYLDEFATTNNLKTFLARNSEKPLDGFYYKAGELASISPVLDSFAFKASLSDFLPATKNGDSFFSARLASIRSMPDSAFVYHILIGAAEGKRADSLVDVLKRGADFDALAQRFSLVPANNPEKPGELGWMTSPMFGGLLDTCLTAPLNTPFSFASQYGIHIFKVTKKSKLHKKVQVAVYEKTTVPGKETFQTYYSQANELVSKSNNKTAIFNQLANENNWPVFPAIGIAEGAKTVANIPNARELTRWAYEAKKGDVSPIISIDNKYFVVATLVGIHEKGIAPLSAKSFEIETTLRREKELKKLADHLQTLMTDASTIEELAERANISVSKQSGIAFGSSGMQQMDPKFIGAISGAREGQLTGPVEGIIGAYVFTVDERQTGAFYTEEDARRYLQQVTGQQNQMSVYVLSKAANVEDNRAKFF